VSHLIIFKEKIKAQFLNEKRFTNAVCNGLKNIFFAVCAL